MDIRAAMIVVEFLHDAIGRMRGHAVMGFSKSAL